MRDIYLTTIFTNISEQKFITYLIFFSKIEGKNGVNSVLVCTINYKNTKPYIYWNLTCISSEITTNFSKPID